MMRLSDLARRIWPCPWPSAAWCTWLTLAALAAVSCTPRTVGLIPPGTSDPDRYVYEAGTEELKAKHWVQARELFRQLIDMYPQSEYRFDAKIALGDTYFGEGGVVSLVEAINEFEEFLRFYPTHPRTDYAQYMIGMAHYEQMLSPDRDQAHTRAALEAFQVFLDTYPASPIIGDARARLRETRNRLSESEFQIGRFYYRLRWYPGATDRLESLLQADPEYSGLDGVYFYLAQSLVELNRSAEALVYLDRLVGEFAESEYVADARKRIDELRALGS